MRRWTAFSRGLAPFTAAMSIHLDLSRTTIFCAKGMSQPSGYQ